MLSGATPVVIDTDIGGDADDAIALTVAARCLPELALVVTSDECAGERARFARHLLDLLGRGDVPVAAGIDLGNQRYFCVEDLVPGDVPGQSGDLLEHLEQVLNAAGKVRWVGIGALSNLAHVVEHRPDLARALEITQMGGALRYRDPTRAEHNFRLDPDAVHRVLNAVLETRLVISDVTFTEELAVDAYAPLYRALAAAAPPWARLLRVHLDRWFERFYPATIQHDALTLSAAMGLGFVDFGSARVALDELARMRADPAGIPVRLSSGARYRDFMDWLTSTIAGSA